MGTYMAKHKVVFLIPYFGRWPFWFPAFAASCANNPEFEWCLITDLPEQPGPPNIKYVSMTLPELLQLAETKLSHAVRKSVYGLCDLRPAFGVLFQDLAEGYDFWGHADIDVVWGRLNLFLSESHLDRYDILSSRRGYVAGHCTAYRNCDRINRLFLSLRGFGEDLAQPAYCHIDEIRMSSLLRKRSELKVYWHAQHVVDECELVRRPYRWRWENGRILDQWHVERAYVHFFTLKRTLRRMDFGFEDRPTAFHITPRGFFSRECGLMDRFGLPPAWWLYRRLYHCAYRLATGRRRQ